MEDAATDPRLVVAWLGVLLVVFGLIWIVWTEWRKRKQTLAELSDDVTWPHVVLYIFKRVPAEHFVAFLLIVLGAAVAVGAVWNAPAAGGAATASPTPS